MIEKQQPLITVGIPTYNRADGYLQQALESAVGQTYPNLEIVVSDNCSTDDTEAVVKGFADPRIRYFRQAQNIKANDNFNFCLEQAEGDYFLLLHDDDMVDLDFVEACLKAANYETHFGILRTGTRIIHGDGAVLREIPNLVGGLSMADFFLGWYTSQTTLYLCSTLFNTKRLKEIGGFQSKHHLFQDVIAEVQLAARFGRVDVPEVKASYRKHMVTRTFAARVSEWCEDSLMLLNIMCDLVAEKRDLVWRRGMRFFTELNYNRVSAIRSPIARFRTYLMVFRMFDYQYSPIRYFLDRKLVRRTRRTVRHLKGKARQALTRAGVLQSVQPAK